MTRKLNSEKNHIEHLSIEELRNYLEGSLIGKEANQIEQHLSNCELCSDALLGLEKIDSRIIAEDVDELRKKVEGRSHVRNKSGWTLRIAAAITLLFISTFFLIDYIKTTSKQEIASAGEAVEEIPQEPESFALKESKPDTSLSVPLDGLAAADESEDIMANSKPAEDSGIHHDISEPAIAATEISPVEDSAGSGLAVESLAGTEDIAAELDPLATEVLAGKEEVSEESRSAAKRLSEPVQAARPQRIQADALRTEPFIEFLPVVNEVFESNAEPLDGLDEYKRTVLSNLNYPVRAAEAGIEGIVSLRFMIDPDGKLSDFLIINGLGYGCDEEAIRVIREGPSWSPAIKEGQATSQQVVIRIPFSPNSR